MVGRYDADSILFGFNVEAMAVAAQDGMLGNVIGHELGHAWCNTLVDSAMSDKSEVNQALVTARENEANAKVMGWGFDMKGLTDWGNEHRSQFAKMTRNPAYLNEFTPIVSMDLAFGLSGSLIVWRDTEDMRRKQVRVNLSRLGGSCALISRRRPSNDLRSVRRDRDPHARRARGRVD